MLLSEYFILSLFIILGGITLFASATNSDWFFNSRQTTMFINWFGRKGARIFYAFLGIGLITAGITGFLTWK